MRPLVTHWRLKGIRVIFYLDDGFDNASSQQACKRNTAVIIECLESAGFLINYEKSELTPKQIGVWLGFQIDSTRMMFFVPPKKVEKLKVHLSEVCNINRASSRTLSKITGTLSSMERALGPLVSLMTRSTNLQIAQNPARDTVTHISEDCLHELLFWYNNIDINNGYSIKRHHTTSQILFSDASDHSYGGYILQRLGKPICQNRFTPDQIGTSSTNRELLAIRNCLQSFAHLIRHEAIEIRTDSQNAARIVQKGSRLTHLQDIAVEIFQICTQHDILLHPIWIPREQNQYADHLSKLTDTDDWSIDGETFSYLCQEFGQPEFDRFADDNNHKVPRFNSRFHCPNTSGVNAFTQDWSDVELNWLCPPVKFICSTLHHARLCKAKGILLVPQWPSSHFWTLIHNGRAFEHFVKSYRIIDPFYTSTAESCQFKGFLSFHAIALLIDFS